MPLILWLNSRWMPLQVVHMKVLWVRLTYVGPTSVQSAHLLFAFSDFWKLRMRSTSAFSLFFFIAAHLGTQQPRGPSTAQRQCS